VLHGRRQTNLAATLCEGGRAFWIIEVVGKERGFLPGVSDAVYF